MILSSIAQVKCSYGQIRHAAGLHGRLVEHGVQHITHTREHMDNQSNCAELAALQRALLELVGQLLAVAVHLASFCENTRSGELCFLSVRT